MVGGTQRESATPERLNSVLPGEPEQRLMSQSLLTLTPTIPRVGLGTAASCPAQAHGRGRVRLAIGGLQDSAPGLAGACSSRATASPCKEGPRQESEQGGRATFPS